MAIDGSDLSTADATGPMGGCGPRLPGLACLSRADLGGRVVIGEPWRLEVIEADALEMDDAQVQQAAVLAAMIARRIPSLDPAVKGFFAELSLQLNGLIGWRASYLEGLELLMRDLPDLTE
jgi:hypothetical protein